MPGGSSRACCSPGDDPSPRPAAPFRPPPLARAHVELHPAPPNAPGHANAIQPHALNLIHPASAYLHLIAHQYLDTGTWRAPACGDHPSPQKLRSHFPRRLSTSHPAPPQAMPNPLLPAPIQARRQPIATAAGRAAHMVMHPRPLPFHIFVQRHLELQVTRVNPPYPAGILPPLHAVPPEGIHCTLAPATWACACVSADARGHTRHTVLERSCASCV